MSALRERLLRHRKDRRLLSGLFLVLLAITTAVYWVLLRGRELPEVLVENRLVLFALWYVNVVLILVVLFVLLRSLAKVLLERKSRILGSQFKVKLVASYFGLSLLPVLALFFIATGLLRTSIDRWFDTPVESVLEQGYQVAQQLTGFVEDVAVRDARQVGREIARFDLASATQSAQLATRVAALRGDLDLDVLAVYEVAPESPSTAAEVRFVHAVVAPRAGFSELPEPSRISTFLLGAVADGKATRLESPRGVDGRLVLGAVPVPARPGGHGGETTVVVAGLVLQPPAGASSARLVQSYQSYRQLEALQEDIRASHLLLFLMVTLLILLASSWTGLHLARRVTVPIQALARGTDRVARGDLATRVEVPADDELGVLVASFNRMTAELERNKAELERGNEELTGVNQRLAEERALIGAVLDNVAAGVLSLHEDGRIFTCNRAALHMLRLREDEVVGRTAEEAFCGRGAGDCERLVPLLGGELAPGGRRRDEVRLVLGGEWKTFEVKVSALGLPSSEGDDGAVRGRVAVLEDLTELIQAQQLAAWNEAAKRIAHEIKNPLTPIRLSAERLQRRAEAGDAALPEAVKEGTEVIGREVETLRRMVDEFSQYARMPRPRPVELEVAPLVEDTLRLYQGLKPGVEVASSIAGAPRLVADAEQVRRALINLLDNAVEATDAPGRVEVGAETRDGHLLLQVRDSGRGIPPEAREKLFLPYFSTKGRGTGLGLAIVHRIVTDHRGTIRVEPNVPQGTVFTIELPLG